MAENQTVFRPIAQVGVTKVTGHQMYPLTGKTPSKAEYVWIDDSNTIKNKTLIMHRKVLDTVVDLPLEQHTPELVLCPVAKFNDCVGIGELDVIVLCEMDKMQSSDSYQEETKREAFIKIIYSDQVEEEALYFDIEQEFVFKQCVDMKNFPMGKARNVNEDFCKACFNAKIPMYSVTHKSSHNECWSYTIGTCVGRVAADYLWISRYIMKRISENVGLTVTFEPLNSIASGDYPAETFQPYVKYRFSSLKMRHNVKPYIDNLFDKLTKDAKPLIDVKKIHHKGFQHPLCQVIIRQGEKSDNVGNGRLDIRDPYEAISYIAKTCFL